MESTAPKVFVLAETMANLSGTAAYLAHVGAPDWATDCPSDTEGLLEMIGRACYRSYAPGLNPNVTQVRKGNATYLNNIIEQRHGSVLEHGWVTFALCDVSRVFTHELVRHRVGTAISQESLRFVRADNVKYWIPGIVREDAAAVAAFEQAVEQAEVFYGKLVALFTKGEEGPFSKKKKWTSAIRRILPSGMATTVIWSTNMRNLRHVVEARTSPEAEEEVRLVFSMVGALARKRWPNLFADYVVENVDGHDWYRTENQKI